MSFKEISRRVVKLVFMLLPKMLSRIHMLLMKTQFKKAGRNFIFSPKDQFSYSTIEVGLDVFIGSGATFSASESGIVIRDKVMVGPNVTIMRGDHRTDVVGTYMFDVKKKLPHNDLPVTIETDVWIGANVIILKGVTIGQGAIVAAGSVVTRDVVPNSVVAGLPAKPVSRRFNEEDIAHHKQGLGLR